MHESNLSENAIRKSPPRSARLQMAHSYRGRRDSVSDADSDLDYKSVCGEQSAHSESDDFARFSDPEIQQTISALEIQLAKLKISVDRIHTRKLFTQPHDFCNSAARSICSACGKNGHSKSNKKCPARSSKCHNCGKLGHWSTVCRSTAVDGTSAAGSHPTGRTSQTKRCTNSRNNTRSQRTLFVGAAPSISGSKETILNPPKNDDGEDRSFHQAYS